MKRQFGLLFSLIVSCLFFINSISAMENEGGLRFRGHSSSNSQYSFPPMNDDERLTSWEKTQRFVSENKVSIAEAPLALVGAITVCQRPEVRRAVISGVKLVKKSKCCCVIQ